MLRRRRGHRASATPPPYPDARFTASYDELLADPDLRAVVLATPVPTHFELARRAILAGKHVMVEKPMTWTAAEAHELRDLVSGSGRVLMVGHLLRFHPGVDKLRELIDSGELGDVRYVYGNRLNLGIIRQDENALWSPRRARHLGGAAPDRRRSRSRCGRAGECYVQPAVEDVVFGYIKFA